MKYLDLDDSESITRLVRALLESAGHAVEVRRQHVQALQDSSLLKPDVVLLDLMMPEMDGFELCRHLREEADQVRRVRIGPDPDPAASPG